jgi:hypothetical protein
MADILSTDGETERWNADYALRKREIEIKEREENRSRWTNPLVIAILAASIAAVGNATVTWMNGLEQRSLERSRAEQAARLEESKAEAERILESIKTLNPEKAAANLKFLLEAGLIMEPSRRASLQKYVEGQPKSTTPTIPLSSKGDLRDACSRFPTLC